MCVALNYLCNLVDFICTGCCCFLLVFVTCRREDMSSVNIFVVVRIAFQSFFCVSFTHFQEKCGICKLFQRDLAWTNHADLVVMQLYASITDFVLCGVIAHYIGLLIILFFWGGGVAFSSWSHIQA